jgi:hypothetical protein
MGNLQTKMVAFTFYNTDLKQKYIFLYLQWYSTLVKLVLIFHSIVLDCITYGGKKWAKVVRPFHHFHSIQICKYLHSPSHFVSHMK